MVAHDYMPELDNYKLTTVCEFFGIEFKAHDALADIKATRELEAHLALIFEDSVT
jgi:DNA polymerase III epsilon subunit-like protein